MDSLNSLAVFVQAAESKSFTDAGRLLGVSSSSIGKSIARMEARLGVRLFHRSTRSITLTSEGTQFLERCRRILGEIEAAELELSQASSLPSGRLRISVPALNELLMPVLIDFMRHYPAIELDVDFSDRMVDVIEEGFDAVLRTGAPQDSRLQSRRLGNGFGLILVGAPSYFARHGVPATPADLTRHACLLHRFPATGKLERWPLRMPAGASEIALPNTLVCTTVDSLLMATRQGMGISCLPDFLVRDGPARGELRQILTDHTEHRSDFWKLWPYGRQVLPKLRALIDHVSQHLFPVTGSR